MCAGPDSDIPSSVDAVKSGKLSSAGAGFWAPVPVLGVHIFYEFQVLHDVHVRIKYLHAILHCCPLVFLLPCTPCPV